MTDTKPGADEVRVRQLLIRQGVGPDAETPIPPKPTARPRDWLDDLLDTNTTSPAPVEEPEEAEPEPAPVPAAPEAPAKAKNPKAKSKKRRRRKRAKRHDPDTPRSAWDSQPQDPRQSLLDAWAGTPYRLKWLAAHLAAAALGWRLGLVDWATDTAAWYAAGHWMSTSAWVLYAFAGLLAALYRMSRRWAWPFRLLASVPIASVVVGVLLYGTGYHR